MWKKSLPGQGLGEAVLVSGNYHACSLNLPSLTNDHTPHNHMCEKEGRSLIRGPSQALRCNLDQTTSCLASSNALKSPFSLTSPSRDSAVFVKILLLPAHFISPIFHISFQTKSHATLQSTQNHPKPYWVSSSQILSISMAENSKALLVSRVRSRLL